MNGGQGWSTFTVVVPWCDPMILSYSQESDPSVAA